MACITQRTGPLKVNIIVLEQLCIFLLFFLFILIFTAQISDLPLLTSYNLVDTKHFTYKKDFLRTYILYPPL